MPNPQTPDAEQMLCDWLQARFTISARTELPDNLEAVVPLIQVVRVSGASTEITIDRPILDIDVYHSTRPLAKALAYEIHDAVIYALPGAQILTGSVLTTGVVVGPAWRPYDNTKIRRVGASYEVSIHALSA